MKKLILLLAATSLAITTNAQTTHTVCNSGCDFTTISAAVSAAAGGDIIEIRDYTHTELGVVIDKDLEVRGLGRDTCVLQADLTPATAADGIFTVNPGVNFTILDITLQHGNRPPGNGGGAVNFLGAGSLTCENVFFNANQASSDGGAVRLVQGELVLTNCKFFNNNSSNLGGAIYANLADGILLNCWFKENSSLLGGGAIYHETIDNNGLQLNSCTFHSNYSDGHGGGLFLYEGNGMADGGDLYIDGSVFIDDSTSQAINYGGSIYIYDADFQISNSAFSSGYSGKYGGALAVFKNTAFNTSSITQTTFDQNKANEGGAVYIRELYNEISIEHCDFTSNEEIGIVPGAGGAISSGMNMGMTEGLFVRNSTFNANIASNGGAIYITLDNAQLEDLVFTDNVAKNNGSGGAVNLNESYFFGDLNWSNLTFDNNTAGKGGALFVSIQWSLGHHTLDNCLFNANSASIDGGAIYWDFEAEATVNKCNFTNNSSAGDGGAVYVYGSGANDFITLDFDSCHFNQNDASQNGGAIAYTDGPSAYRSGAVFTKCGFEANTAGNDGGALIWGKGNVDVECCTFNDNSASQDGGAIYHLNSGEIKIQNSTIVDNRADRDAGAIYALHDVYLNNSTVSRNTCDFDADGAGNGGAIWDNDGYAYLKNTICADNLDMGNQFHEFYSTGNLVGVFSYGWNLVGNLGFYQWESNTNNDIYGDPIGINNPNGNATEYHELTPAEIGVLPLDDNNGFTKTCGISATSLAVNGGTLLDSDGQSVAVDQRGIGAIDNKDIGAYERYCLDHTVTDLPILCGNSGIQTLNVATPGGTWTGANVTGNTFDPAENLGYHALTYTIAQEPNCPSSSTIYVQVDPVTSAGNSVQKAYCEVPSSINLFTLLGEDATPGGHWEDLDNSWQLTGHILDPRGLNGKYDFVYTMYNAGCGDDESLISLTFGACTDIGENQPLGEFNIYPNPSNGQFSITIEDQNITRSQLKMLDSRGKVVHQEALNPTNFGTIDMNMSQLKPGVYTLLVISDEKAQHKNVIIQ